MIRDSKLEVTITSVPNSSTLVFATGEGRYVLKHHDSGRDLGIKSSGKIIQLKQTNGTRPHIDMMYIEKYIVDNIKEKSFSELTTRDEIVLKSILIKMGEMSGRL